MNLKITITILTIIGVLLFLGGCIKDPVGVCGDGVCEQKEFAAGTCQADCGTTDSNEICGNSICEQKELANGTCQLDCETTDSNSQIESKIFTSSTQAKVSNFAFCGNNCISFQVSQTPLINEEFWVKISSKENPNQMIELLQADCTIVSNNIKCTSTQVNTLDKTKIYTFKANIPINTTITASTTEKENPEKALFADSTESITASGEICANCNSNQLDDGETSVNVDGKDIQGTTEIVCSAISSTTRVNPLVWKFIPLENDSSRFTKPNAECVEDTTGRGLFYGKSIKVTGTGEANNFGAWVTEYPTRNSLSGLEDYSRFSISVLGSGLEADQVPNLVTSFSDDLGEINYNQTYFAVWGVPYNTPLTPRLHNGTSTRYIYNLIYPSQFLLSRFSTAQEGKLKYSLIFDGVNNQSKKPIPTSTSFYAAAQNDPMTIIGRVISNELPNNLITKFNLKDGLNGFEKELFTEMTEDQLYHDPAKGLVIKLNNQRNDTDAQWTYYGEDLKLSDLTSLYKVKVVIGSSAAQGKTPKFSAYVNDKAWEIASGISVIPKVNSDRHPSNGNTKTYEFFLAPPSGATEWDGGYKEAGLGFHFRMYHKDDTEADPNAMIWLESLEFYGPGGSSQDSICGNGTVEKTGVYENQEECDLQNLDGKICQNLGFAGGSLACTSTCDFNTSQCVSSGSMCGNGIIDSGEQCDNLNLNGKTCEKLGFTGGGSISCNADCILNTSNCIQTQPTCGNGLIDTGEQCDGSNVNGKTCDDIGYSNGIIACNSNCTFEVSNCLPIENGGFETWDSVKNSPQNWNVSYTMSGNNSLEQSTDKVEGSKSLKIITTSTNFAVKKGFLMQEGDIVTVTFNAKASNRSRPYLATFTAYPYGGGVTYTAPNTVSLEGSNTNWEEKTITYTVPKGKTNAGIRFSIKNVDYRHRGTAYFDNVRVSISRNNKTECVKPFVRHSICDTMTSKCGDGVISGYENCEGTNFESRTCETYFYTSGTLSCNDCRIDTSNCITCGNGAIENGEECDGTNFGGKTCDSYVYEFGTLTCTYDCKIDISNCSDDHP